MSYVNFILEEAAKKSADDKKAYQAYFDKILTKYKVESPEDLSDEEKKKFFAEVDKGWNAEAEAGKDGKTEAKEEDDDKEEDDVKEAKKEVSEYEKELIVLMKRMKADRSYSLIDAGRIAREKDIISRGKELKKKLGDKEFDRIHKQHWLKEEAELEEAKMTDEEVVSAAKALVKNGDEKAKKFGQGLLDYNKDNDGFHPNQVSGLQNIMKNASFQMAKKESVEEENLEEGSSDFGNNILKFMDEKLIAYVNFLAREANGSVVTQKQNDDFQKYSKELNDAMKKVNKVKLKVELKPGEE